MVHRVVIHATPLVVADKGCNQQQQRGLWLVEVGDHTAHDTVLKAWSNHQLSTTHIGVGMVPVQVVHNVLQGLLGRDLAGRGVGHPLGDSEGFLVGIGVVLENLADIVQALERAHTGGSHSDDGARGIDDVEYHIAWHADELIVHRVVADVLALKRNAPIG